MLHAFPRTFRPGDLPPPVNPRALSPAPATDTVLPPLTPPAYLRLRRKAAGFTVEEVAARLSGFRTALLADTADLVRLLESPGIRARLPETLERLRAIFPFDPDVYRQLADEPADRHPRICRSCGASRWDADDEAGQVLGWVTAALCTRCVDDAVSGRCR